MTTVYPSAYDTLTSTSLGVSKSNSEPIVIPSEDIDAAEWNTVAGAIRQLEIKLGDGSSALTRYGDADLNNVREAMGYMAQRADRAGVMDHFLLSAWTPAFFDDIGAVAVYAQVAGGVGVGQIIAAAGAATGFSQATDHFHQRTSYYRCRFQMATLPAGVGDTLNVGLIRDATHYVKIYAGCTNAAGPVWTPWYCEVNNGGAVAGGALVAMPEAATWHTFEILSTAAGAFFYYDRGLVTEGYLAAVQAPENGYCHPCVLVTSAAGGQVMNNDLIACRDTRQL